MSSGAFAQARAFFLKANELSAKGHLLRAAENFGRAAEAARALDSGPDNLVAVHMQSLQAAMLQNHCAVVANTTADPDEFSAHRADSVALLSAAVAALERRRVAGTLLEGKCSAAEEAWDAAEWRESRHTACKAASLAKLVGYDVFLQAAFSVMVLFWNAWVFAGECSAPQFQSFAELVVHAADLMQLPRSHSTMKLHSEVAFTEKLSFVLAADDVGRRGLDARLVELLKDAWQRLQRSGVLEARGILDDFGRLEYSTYQDKSAAAIHAAMAAPGLRSCALAGCGAKEAHPQHFKRCSACRTVVYCSKEHQLEDWPSHKKACKAACMAAAAASHGSAGPGAAS